MTFEEPCFQVPRRCESERAKRKRLQKEKNSLKQTSMEGTLATEPLYKKNFCMDSNKLRSKSQQQN